MPPDCPVLHSDSDKESVLSLHGEVCKKKQRRNSRDPKYFCCIDGGCGASFKRLDQLDRHEYHHTGVKKHICLYDNCEKSYSIVTHLKRHMRLTHERKSNESSPKIVKCSIEECKKMFTNACNMKRHVREAHEHPKEYDCNYCKEKFKQKLKLRRHEIVKHTRAFPYKCNKCDRGFHQRWQQEKHMPACKVYCCDDCEMLFNKWTLYLKHCREMQHGRKYHICEKCGKTYSKQNDLRKHYEAKHSSDKTNDSNQSFACTEPKCNRVYAYERNLRQHILTAHTGRRFKCTFKNCKCCFSSSQNLVKHLEREHNPREEQQPHSIEGHKKTTKAVKRRKRKDAGQPVVSNLAKFTGLKLSKDFNKQLRERAYCALETTKLALMQKTTKETPDIEELLQEALK